MQKVKRYKITLSFVLLALITMLVIVEKSFELETFNSTSISATSVTDDSLSKTSSTQFFYDLLNKDSLTTNSSEKETVVKIKTKKEVKTFQSVENLLVKITKNSINQLINTIY